MVSCSPWACRIVRPSSVLYFAVLVSDESLLLDVWLVLVPLADKHASARTRCRAELVALDGDGLPFCPVDIVVDRGLALLEPVVR